MEKCGAKTRAGTPCKHEAGWGTDHPGTGRCKFHGGKSTGPNDQAGNKNAVKHGTYETIIRDRLTQEEQAVFDAVPDQDNLKQELRILRFKLLRLLEPVERQTIAGTKDTWDVVTLEVDEVTKAYAIEKLVDGIRKVVKEMQGTEDDGAIDGLIEALRESRRRANE